MPKFVAWLNFFVLLICLMSNFVRRKNEQQKPDQLLNDTEINNKFESPEENENTDHDKNKEKSKISTQPQTEPDILDRFIPLLITLKLINYKINKIIILIIDVVIVMKLDVV